MKLSTKVRYGTRMMLDLAINSDKGPVAIKDIAQRQEISEKYLEQIIPLLKAAGLVKSIRGARGGYVLTKPSSEIMLGDIVTAIEGDLSLVECIDTPSACHRISYCVTREIWGEISKKMLEVLNSVNLDYMVNRYKNKASFLTYNI